MSSVTVLQNASPQHCNAHEHVKTEPADNAIVEDEDHDDEDEDEDEDEEDYEDDSVADMDEEETEEALKDALLSIHHAGDFASWMHMTDYVDPGLIVDQNGPIELPLQEAGARRIIAASHQAPFGLGSETIVDKSVRNTWELNHDQFSFANAGFMHSMSKIVRESGKRL